MFKRGITDLKVIYYLQGCILRQEKGEKVNSYDVIMYEKIRSFLAINDKFSTNQKNAGCDFSVNNYVVHIHSKCCIRSLLSSPKLRLIISSCGCYIIYSECCLYMVSSKQKSQLWLNNNHSDSETIILDNRAGPDSLCV